VIERNGGKRAGKAAIGRVAKAFLDERRRKA
jgi:hypothetical protein